MSALVAYGIGTDGHRHLLGVHIAVGTNDVVIAGGVESMTMVPMTAFHLSASPELMDKLPGATR